MRITRLAVVLALIAATSILRGAGEAPSLARGNKLFAEHSYQLALDQYKGALVAGLAGGEKREATLMAGRALQEMNRHDESRKYFEELTADGAEDVWAGRAHWRMETGLSERYAYYQPPTSAPLEHLRVADEILTREKPSDLADFYHAVVFIGIGRIYQTDEKDRGYLFGFIDRLQALLKDKEEIAQLIIRKASLLNFVTEKPHEEERLAMLRSVVSEFPDTKAAAGAQFQIAQFYVQKKDLVSALAEYKVVIAKFPKSPEAESAAKEAANIKQAEVLFNLSASYLPDEEITFPLYGRNISDVKISLIPFDPAATLRDQKEMQFYLKGIIGTPSYTQPVSLQRRDDYQPTTVSVTLNHHAPGAYVMKAESAGAASYGLLLISDILLVSNSAGDALELWTVDAKTGKPRSSTRVVTASEPVPVKTHPQDRGEMRFSKFEDSATDENGFANVTFSKPYEQCLIVASSGQNYAFLDNVYWNHYERESGELKAYVYTDRPVYRPKQTMYWRALMRDSKDGQYRNLGGKAFMVSIRDPQGKEVYPEKRHVANEFGALSDSLELDEKAALGQYQINIRDEAASRNAGGNFRVEEYKKPEYEVKVSSGDPLYRIGSDVAAKVSANYYFGGAVADAQVRYTVRRRPHWFPWWNLWSTGEAGDDLGWFDRAPEERGAMHNSGGDIVATGEGKTDKDGNFIIKFKADVPDPNPQTGMAYVGGRVPRNIYNGDSEFGSFGAFYSYSAYPQARAYDFQIEATVTDKSRRNIDGSDKIVVSDKAIQVAVRTKQHIYTPGDTVKADLSSRNFNDKPVATNGTLYVQLLKWNPDAKQDNVTTLTSIALDIGSSGSLSHSCRIPQDVTGRLAYLFEANDPFGGKTYGAAEFTVADEKTQDIFYKYQGVSLIVDKDSYDVGDTARVIVLSEFRDAYAWYWTDTGSGNVEKRVVQLPNRTNFFTIPITEAFVPNSMIHVVSVHNKRLIEDQKEFVVPPKRKTLMVTVKSDKETYKPGEEGTVEISAKDYLGKPVRGEFSLSMFDSSILYIAPEMREDIRHAYYGARRALRYELRNSIAEAGGYNLHVPEAFNVFNGEMSALNSGNLGFSFDEDRNGFAQNRPMMKAMGGGRRGVALAAAPAAGNASYFAVNGQLAAESGRPEVLSDALDKDSIAPIAESKKENAPLIEPTIRTDFRDSMYWSPSVITDDSGHAIIKVKFPDSLTTWRVVGVGTTAETLVGNANAETTVRKNIIARLETPRFFRERDQVTLSGIVHNYLDKAQEVKMRLSVTGLDAGETSGSVFGEKSVHVEPGAEARVDWLANAKQWGDATIQLQALTASESDAVEMKFPVLPHGIDKFVAWNGSSADQSSDTAKMEREGDKVTITRTVEIPKERIVGSTKLEILINPSLASAIKDAIPYLIEYPYGCVEQTMSRFMPAAVAAGTFRELGVPPNDLLDKKLPDVISQGLQRITDFQHGDGGWGWWHDDSTNDYMTAYVMYGLTLARQADVKVDDSMFNRGLDYLAIRAKKHEDWNWSGYYWRYNSLHTLAYQALVLSLNNRTDRELLEYIYKKRDDLTPQGLAMLARALWHSDRKDDARVVLRNMYNVAVITPENDTARWGLLKNAWYWWNEATEATAQGLMAYLEIDPQNPMTTKAMKWLVLNRQGNRWKCTKDTAQSVLALAAYIRDRYENTASMKIDVKVGNAPAKTIDLTPANFWNFDGRVTLDGDAVPDGQFPIVITKTGGGTLFYGIHADYFTLEEHIKKAGNEIYVERAYEKLVRESVKNTTAVVAVDKYVPIHDGDTVNSGDELRATLKIKSLNDYEYLLFEDPKPAGMEPVTLQSGSVYAGFCSNMELRDQMVSFFVTYMPQGTHEITYNCRAETPGVFHTMPTKGYAMYFPELRANSDEIIIKVVDK